jgi:hypothetical protein
MSAVHRSVLAGWCIMKGKSSKAAVDDHIHAAVDDQKHAEESERELAR